MPARRAAGEWTALIGLAARYSIPMPTLLQCIEAEGAWYAVFRFVEGERLPAAGPRWTAAWAWGFGLLRILDAIRPAAGWRADRAWLERLVEACPAEGEPRELVRELSLSRPGGELSLAHGDFAPQNVLDTATGLMLIDWEEVGASVRGFDAGWLLALNRLGAGPRLEPAALRERCLGSGVPPAHLRWCEGLGLGRLLYRATHGGFAEPQAARLRGRVREAIRDFLAEKEQRRL